MNKLLLLAACCVGSLQSIGTVPTYRDVNAPIEERVADALSRLTLQEKTALLHAQSKFSSAGVPRLGIPELWCTDGPHGIRPEVLWDEWDQAGWTNDSCTAFPALSCLAATWNPDMALLYGTAIGEEALYRGKDVLLGPGVNIYRTPLNGRNFEYMGEDPYLAATMVVPYIKGVQSNGVAACVKHYALNNQETRRSTVDVDVDDRALYEIYLPAFKAAVQEGNVWALMTSYNLYRGTSAGQNKRLLDDILRGEWGFDGAVVSDWGGVYNTDQVIAHGVDLEFGTWTNGLSAGSKNAYDNYHLACPYLQRLQSGSASMEELDRRVAAVLRLMFRTSMNPDKGFGEFASPAHYRAARQIADEGIVLLKNDRNLLPLNPGDTKKILVVGENAIKMMTVGGGSSSLKVKDEFLPLESLRKRLGDKVEIVYARGYVGDVTGSYNGVTSGQNLEETRSADELIAEAVSEARDADCVLFFGGLNKKEGQDCEAVDRAGLGLPYDQDNVVEALAAVNPNIVFVNISGNAVAMPWVDKVPAILQAWFIGTMSGEAIADILLGEVNPSGKLPFTFPRSLGDVGAHRVGEYPCRADELLLNRPNNQIDTVHQRYNESLFVGYRWADKEKTAPLFPFGHGLSYTSFEYGKPTLSSKTMTAGDSITVSVPVTNTGDRVGSEIVQLYISDLKSALPRPVKELKGFQKLTIEPGQTTMATFTIDSSSLQYFDDAKHQWVAEPGKFKAIIGASSRDLRGDVTFELK